MKAKEALLLLEQMKFSELEKVLKKKGIESVDKISNNIKEINFKKGILIVTHDASGKITELEGGLPKDIKSMVDGFAKQHNIENSTEEI